MYEYDRGDYICFRRKKNPPKYQFLRYMEELLPDMRDFDEREAELYSRMISKRGTIGDSRILTKIQE